MAGTTRKQNYAVVAVAIVVVVGSVFFTLYLAGVLFAPREGGNSRGYNNITFTDAVLSCREDTSDTYGKRIRNLVTDNHSSRFDDQQFVYKIFLKMDLYEIDGKGVKLHYVNCFVRSSNGNIVKYEVYQDDVPGSDKPTDDTNMFGMPKRG